MPVTGQSVINWSFRGVRDGAMCRRAKSAPIIIINYPFTTISRKRKKSYNWGKKKKQLGFTYENEYQRSHMLQLRSGAAKKFKRLLRLILL